MNDGFQIILMAIIGALIGGLTNMLAIRMLFRPYETKYLFGRRLPLTPGVIPRRREEASIKMGEIVTRHLLTPDAFIEKIKSRETQNFIMLFIDRQIETIESEKLTLRYFLERINEGLSDKVVKGFNAQLSDKVTAEGARLYQQEIRNLVPTDAMATLDGKIDTLQPQITQKIEEYINSEKGYQDLYTMTDEFVEHRGRLARSLKYLMSKETIVQNIRNELNKLIHHPKMTEIQVRIINDEYERIKNSRVDTLISERDQQRLIDSVYDVLRERIDIEGILDYPIEDFNREMFESFKTRGKYQLRDNIIEYLGQNTGRIVEKLQLAQVVKKQIDSFELSHIEDLVMEISSKEFRMITLLGFFLGGMIGIVQGLIVVFL
ncbi:DUF445 domain-containing protein [Salinicoccus roseus]|uniref:DUF445 domain-containing protein n=1 Tax=Salinicoccus roseus TaxID=45670 RepID=UPI000F4DB4ED|nr:DUF445 family protein [Salinicoccus roseus]RPE53817.1 uncharacterized membrane protein YheB (UPF0754 family) [Salinicoccus roseus]GGA70729.1 UPF0754 membrane protein [Salinicoccus roseus]